MDFYTLYNLKEDVDSNLHSGGVSGLQNWYNTVDKARRAMLGKIRPEELIRKGYLEQALYPRVDQYALPNDIKYDDVIEIQKLSSYRNVDTMLHPLELVFRRRFNQKRSGAQNVMYIGYENGVKYARIFRPVGLCDYRTVPIDNFDSLQNNGTWNTGGNLVNLKLDELNHVAGHASFSFDLNDSSTSGFLENFTLQSFSLDGFLQRGAVFTWFDFPIPKNITSVKITMGSDASDLTNNLYTATVNQPHDNNEFVTSWNLLKWMLNNLTSIGTPNPKALVYLRFDITTTGEAVPNCHIDNCIARIGTVYEIVYNSRYMFMDARSGAWKKFANSDSDIVVGEEDTYNILSLETTLAAQKEIYGSAIAAQSDVADVEQQLVEAYEKFAIEHKSEALVKEEDSHVFGNMYDGYTGDIENNGGDVTGPQLFG